MFFVLVVWICEIWHCCCGHIGHNCWHSWFICKLWPILKNQEWSTSWWNEQFHRKLFQTIQIDSTVSITNLQRWTIERYFALFCVNNVLFAQTIWLALNKKKKFERIWCDVSIDTMWTNVKKKKWKTKTVTCIERMSFAKTCGFCISFSVVHFSDEESMHVARVLLCVHLFTVYRTRNRRIGNQNQHFDQFRRVVSVCLSTEFQ